MLPLVRYLTSLSNRGTMSDAAEIYGQFGQTLAFAEATLNKVLERHLSARGTTPDRPANRRRMLAQYVRHATSQAISRRDAGFRHPAPDRRSPVDDRARPTDGHRRTVKQRRQTPTRQPRQQQARALPRYFGRDRGLPLRLGQRSAHALRDPRDPHHRP